MIASLVKKGVIAVHEPATTDSGSYTQFTWPVAEEARGDYVGKLIIEVAA